MTSEPYFKSLNESVVPETAHTVTLYSGKFVHKCDLSISLGGCEDEGGSLKAVSPSGTATLRGVQTDWDARKIAALAAFKESGKQPS